ncbi:hypothetical protein Tco_0568753 [Tanacetum coccineum]
MFNRNFIPVIELTLMGIFKSRKVESLGGEIFLIFYAPLLSGELTSNSWRSKLHRSNLGLASCLARDVVRLDVLGLTLPVGLLPTKNHAAIYYYDFQRASPNSCPVHCDNQKALPDDRKMSVIVITPKRNNSRWDVPLFSNAMLTSRVAFSISLGGVKKFGRDHYGTPLRDSDCLLHHLVRKRIAELIRHPVLRCAQRWSVEGIDGGVLKSTFFLGYLRTGVLNWSGQSVGLNNFCKNDHLPHSYHNSFARTAFRDVLQWQRRRELVLIFGDDNGPIMTESVIDEHVKRELVFR